MRSSITGLTGFVWLPVLNHSLAVSIIWVRWFWPSSFSFARHQHDTLGSLFPKTRDVAARDSDDKWDLSTESRDLFALAFMGASFKFATPCWCDAKGSKQLSKTATLLYRFLSYLRLAKLLFSRSIGLAEISSFLSSLDHHRTFIRQVVFHIAVFQVFFLQSRQLWASKKVFFY